MDELVKHEENKVAVSSHIDTFNLKKLTPFRIIDLNWFDGTILYEFQKVKIKSITEKDFTWRQPYDLQIALIVYNRKTQLFKVHYDSQEHGPQRVMDLTLDKLGAVIDELKLAGFN